MCGWLMWVLDTVQSISLGSAIRTVIAVAGMYAGCIIVLC